MGSGRGRTRRTTATTVTTPLNVDKTMRDMIIEALHTLAAKHSANNIGWTTPAITQHIKKRYKLPSEHISADSVTRYLRTMERDGIVKSKAIVREAPEPDTCWHLEKRSNSLEKITF